MNSALRRSFFSIQHRFLLSAPNNMSLPSRCAATKTATTCWSSSSSSAPASSQRRQVHYSIPETGDGVLGDFDAYYNANAALDALHNSIYNSSPMNRTADSATFNTTTTTSTTTDTRKEVDAREFGYRVVCPLDVPVDRYTEVDCHFYDDGHNSDESGGMTVSFPPCGV